MKPLLKKRISLSFSKTAFAVNTNLNGGFADWPLAKIEFYKNYLITKVLFKKIKLFYRDIDSFYWNGARIKIKHHNKKQPEHIYIGGAINSSLLYRRIKELSIKNKLKLKFD